VAINFGPYNLILKPVVVKLYIFGIWMIDALIFTSTPFYKRLVEVKD
jgi:hypothetical protein